MKRQITIDVNKKKIQFPIKNSVKVKYQLILTIRVKCYKKKIHVNFLRIVWSSRDIYFIEDLGYLKCIILFL